MTKRDKISIALLCMVFPVAVFVWCNRLSKGHSIPCLGGQSLNIVLSEEPVYLQTDRRWADKTIGGCNETISSVGCTICCISMGLAEFDVDIQPDRLNDLLIEAGGYTDRGWVIWSSVSDATNHKVKVDVIPKVSHKAIDRALQEGFPVIAKVYINNSIAHWVLISGKDGMDYLIKDPLRNSRKELEKISKYDSNIYAIRILKPIE